MTKRTSKIHRRVQQTPKERALEDLNKAQRDRERAIELLDKNHAIPDNRSWDQANETYHKIVSTIDQAHQLACKQFEKLLNSELQKHLDDPIKLAANLQLAERDITNWRNQISRLYERHAGRNGGAHSAEELVEVMEICDRYAEVMAMYDGNVVPVISFALEMIAVAEGRMQQQLAADPNVITDAVIKEKA